MYKMFLIFFIIYYRFIKNKCFWIFKIKREKVIVYYVLLSFGIEKYNKIKLGIFEL